MSLNYGNLIILYGRIRKNTSLNWKVFVLDNRILLVEDDEDLVRGISYTLEKEGYIVDNASNLTEALNKMNTKKYNLILLDVMLPDGNGYDLCKKIRENSSVPIIFITACSEELDIIMGLDLGGDDYIVKPFKVRELLSRIRAVLRRNTTLPEHTSRNTIISGEIKIDLIERRLWKNNEEIILTPTEFKIIAYLAQNPLMNLDRSRILSKLSSTGDEYIDDNTLNVYIRRIRTKIEDNPSQPKYIVTVRGFGYRWVQECTGKESEKHV